MRDIVNSIEAWHFKIYYEFRMKHFGTMLRLDLHKFKCTITKS